MSHEQLKINVISDDELFMEFQSRNEFIAPIRAMLKEFANRKGFEPAEVSEIQLAVNEALANIIEHAYSGRDDGLIELGVEMGEDKGLAINIRDYGEKVKKDAIRSRELDDLQDSGLGVFLINELMDTVEYNTENDEGTSLHLTKKKEIS